MRGDPILQEMSIGISTTGVERSTQQESGLLQRGGRYQQDN